MAKKMGRLLLLLLLYACFTSPVSCSLKLVLQGMEDFGANYVKLRDRPLRPLYMYSSEDRPYIDLLVADFAQACAFLTRTICPPRNATLQVLAKGAYFNLRVPGDDYYPSRWAEQMLQRRVRGPDGLWHLNDEFQYFATLYEVVVKGQIGKGDLDEVNALSNICTLTTQLKTWALCLKQWMNTRPEFSNPCNNFGCSYLTQMGLQQTCIHCKKVSTLRTAGSSYQATVVSADSDINHQRPPFESTNLSYCDATAYQPNRTLHVSSSIETCHFIQRLERFHIKYVILRGLPLQHTDAHPDIDILIQNYSLACRVLTGKLCPLRRLEHQAVTVGMFNSYFDLRVVGDHYYPEEWANKMLLRRVRGSDGLYHLENKDKGYALMYHVVVHKGFIGDGYLYEVQKLVPHCNLTENMATWVSCLQTWMAESRFSFSETCHNCGGQFLAEVGLMNTCGKCKESSAQRCLLNEQEEYKAALLVASWPTSGPSVVLPSSKQTSPIDTAIGPAIKKHDMQVVVSVLSRRSGFETRQVIRDTWASGHNNVYFIIGACCPVPVKHRKKFTCIRKKMSTIDEQTEWDKRCAQEDLKIADEDSKYKDIIKIAEFDVYFNLSRKVMSMYKWILKHTTVKWIAKIDDDVYVRIPETQRWLSTILPHMTRIGISSPFIKVFRSGQFAEDKYADDKYPKDTYPPYLLGGSGYIISSDIAKSFVDNEKNIEFYTGEDVSQGIWIEQLNLKTKLLDDQLRFTPHSEYGNCDHPTRLFSGHTITPSQMRVCYDTYIRNSIVPKNTYVGVTLIGGLGNNLFMLTSVIGIAHRNKATPCYNINEAHRISMLNTIDNKVKDLINIDIQKCPSIIYATQYEQGFAKYLPFVLQKSTIVGRYLQSYKYFVKMPVIKESARIFAKKYISFRSNSVTNIGIHVRRGDLLSYGYLRFPPEQYFKNAMHYFRDKYVNVQFFVSSDDIGWCKKQPYFKETHIISEKHTAIQDMSILANCDHVIISIGTFGWWSGMLSGGEVVYYENEFKMEHKINKGKVETQDYYPPKWKKMNDMEETPQ